MEKLSVVIITFNEERNIGRCIDSLDGVADEIIILDSFSTDRTKEICIEKGAVFFEHLFDGYIEQKNRAVGYATNNHILSLDADESLDEKLKKSILDVKSNWEKEGYYMNRLTNYCGHWVKHCGWYPDKKLRLWDRRKGHWTGTNPHDKYELFEGDKKTGWIKGDILHYSYNSVEEHTRQNEKFSSISAESYFKKGKRSNWFKIIISPFWTFISGYFLRLGFLDGYYGFVISKKIAHLTFLKYRKLYALQRKEVE